MGGEEVKMPRKNKALKGPKAEVKRPREKQPARPKAEVIQECKACGSELKKLLYDSRAKKKVYLHVCDKGDCPLYRQPQKYNGVLPVGINIAIA